MVINFSSPSGYFVISHHKIKPRQFRTAEADGALSKIALRHPAYSYKFKSRKVSYNFEHKSCHPRRNLEAEVHWAVQIGSGGRIFSTLCDAGGDFAGAWPYFRLIKAQVYAFGFSIYKLSCPERIFSGANPRLRMFLVKR